MAALHAAQRAGRDDGERAHRSYIARWRQHRLSGRLAAVSPAARHPRRGRRRWPRVARRRCWIATALVGGQLAAAFALALLRVQRMERVAIAAVGVAVIRGVVALRARLGGVVRRLVHHRPVLRGAPVPGRRHRRRVCPSTARFGAAPGHRPHGGRRLHRPGAVARCAGGPMQRSRRTWRRSSWCCSSPAGPACARRSQRPRIPKGHSRRRTGRGCWWCSWCSWGRSASCHTSCRRRVPVSNPPPGCSERSRRWPAWCSWYGPSVRPRRHTACWGLASCWGRAWCWPPSSRA